MSDRRTYEIVAGVPEPLGATLSADGANFAVFSRHAEAIDLCVFDSTGRTERQRLALTGRSGDVWHGFVPGAQDGLLYGYRVHGRHAPRDGHRFNPNKLLMDPCARALSSSLVLHETQLGYRRDDAEADLSFDASDSAPFMPKCRLVASGPPADTGAFPRTPWRDTVIYELHVKGFSKLDPDVPERQRGTYAAIASDVALARYKSLGITAIELLPILAFNDEPHLVAKGLVNYWGYNPFCFQAPEPRYAGGDARIELAHAVRRLHDAGIEVILDVVFNHTGEGWHLGPTLSLKGIDNASYYCLDPTNPSRYLDLAGCGNALDFTQPHVQFLLRDSLRAWITDFGIDGFRFDLATTIARTGPDRSFEPHSEIFALLASDPIVSRAKLIAEPWDVGPEGYRLGQFPGGWAEWNDKARDGIRRFWRGDERMAAELARRISGSTDDLGGNRAPLASINFVAAHDGMRLRDLVTFEAKRNLANSENNRDGGSDDHACAYGPEGPSIDPVQRTTRLRQIRNMLATVLLSQGVPMLCAGDEIGFSQGGNNNPYCQDNPVTWVDWRAAVDEGHELFEFVRQLLAIRRRYPALRRQAPLMGAPIDSSGVKDATWLAADGREMTSSDWELPWVRSFGLMLAALPEGPAEHLLLLLNGHDGEVLFRLPEAPTGEPWHCLLDTAEVAGYDPIERDAPLGVLTLAPRSLVLLSAETLRAARRFAADTEEPLRQLAELAGVASSFHDIDGVEHIVSPETQRALLSAMGFDVGHAELEREALRQLAERDWRTLLPPSLVVRLAVDEPFARDVVLPITLESRKLGLPLRWTLTGDDGFIRTGEARGRDLVIIESRPIGGTRRLRLVLRITGPIPLGYHVVVVEHAGREASCELIVAPHASYQPEWMRAGERVWGVAHQLYALRREPDLGIGDFSALAELVDAVGVRGGAAVGVNPLHALSAANLDDASPYAPSSRLFLNPLYIDPLSVPEAAGSFEGFDGAAAAKEGSGRFVDYPRVRASKMPMLERLFARFEQGSATTAGAARAAAFEQFLTSYGKPLTHFTLHQVLEERLGRAGTSGWQLYSAPNAPAACSLGVQEARRLRFHAWLQFEADRQLSAVGAKLKLGLYGDVAVGVDPSGADVWSEPETFSMKVRFGAPPDQFAREGQNWGMLPFDPQHLRRTACRPFRAVLRSAMHYCGAIRLDHVMWLERMFWIPQGGKPADGAYVRYPLDELLGILALESDRRSCLVVGEDLGTVPEGFRERIEREGLLSYRLMRFERYASGLYRRPSTYPRASLATPASHDLPTIVGHLAGRDIEVRQELGLLSGEEAERERTERALEIELIIAALVDQELLADDLMARPPIEPMRRRALIEAIHRFLARSPAALLMLNIEDLAGSTDQVNLPGPLVGYPCWRNRLARTALQILDDPYTMRMLAAIAAERAGTSAACS